MSRENEELFSEIVQKLKIEGTIKEKNNDAIHPQIDKQELKQIVNLV